jgi:hypothetical protein
VSRRSESTLMALGAAVLVLVAVYLLTSVVFGTVTGRVPVLAVLVWVAFGAFLVLVAGWLDRPAVLVTAIAVAAIGLLDWTGTVSIGQWSSSSLTWIAVGVLGAFGLRR